MELTVFDVGHGFCAYLHAHNGNGILFDCGHDDGAGFRPSTYFPSIGVSRMHEFVLGNFDSDHVSDLGRFVNAVNIGTFTRNPTIRAETLRALKLQGGPLTTGMQAAINLHATYTQPLPAPLDFAGVTVKTFYNSYPEFTDTNNLSLVTFLRYDGMGVIIPGDMERAGWLRLLCDPSFCAWLGTVNIFIASHHGRESGYCEEVFGHCQPDVIIISDRGIEYETQEHCYDDHATGIRWNSGRDECTRYVLTTRKDGHIVVSKQPGQGYRVTAYGSTIPRPLRAMTVGA